MLIPTELTISNNRTAQVWKRKKVKDGIQALTRDAAKDRYPVGKANIYVGDRKSTRLNSSHTTVSRMPSSA